MRRLRIDFVSPPFAGHLHPIIGMARAVQPYYDVRVLTTPAAQPSVRAAGISSLPMLAGWEEQLADVVNTPEAVGSNPLRLYRQLSQAIRIHEQVGIELNNLYRGAPPDLMIADFTLAAAGAVADARRIPWWTSLPSPCVLEGGDGPPSYLGGLRPRPGWVGQCRNRMGWAAIRGFKRLAAAAFRRDLQRIGIHALYREDGSEALYSQQRILAIGWRDLEFRRDWPPQLSFVPPFLYTPPMSDSAPSFAPGRPHVLVTLGTHLDWVKDQAARAVRDAALRTPHVEYHFSDGHMGGKVHSQQDNFRRLPFVDYAQHIGKYDLVIHHGGSGVMYHCLARARPCLVYPVDYDQFDNAARLEHAGLGLRLKSLSEIGTRVESTLADAGLRGRCMRFAECHDAVQSAEVFKAHIDEWMGG